VAVLAAVAAAAAAAIEAYVVAAVGNCTGGGRAPRTVAVLADTAAAGAAAALLLIEVVGVNVVLDEVGNGMCGSGEGIAMVLTASPGSMEGGTIMLVIFEEVGSGNSGMCGISGSGEGIAIVDTSLRRTEDDTPGNKGGSSGSGSAPATPSEELPIGVVIIAGELLGDGSKEGSLTAAADTGTS
jgi:hypothetical protein